jgi:hypothetical protein
MFSSKVRFVSAAVSVYFLAVAIYVLVLFLYILTWQGIVAGVIPLSFSSSSTSSFSSSASSNQTLTISASAEMIIYRYGFLPVYWSRIGDLTVYHQICFSLLTFELVAASVLKYKRLTFPKQKLLKPKTSIPMHGGEQMPKTDKKGKASRLILTFWAFVGFAWFIVYQLLPVIPYDISLALVEFLNLFMWILAFASAALIVLPYLKVLYLKIWGGGEKNE